MPNGWQLQQPGHPRALSWRHKLTPEMLLQSHPAVLETQGGHVAGTTLPLSLEGRESLSDGRQPEPSGRAFPRPHLSLAPRNSHSSLAKPWPCCVTLAMSLIFSGQFPPTPASVKWTWDWVITETNPPPVFVMG